MDSFRRAASFYSQAFDAQTQAADAQQFLQKPGVENAGSKGVYSNPVGAPVPPKSGEFGVSKGEDSRVEEMKRFMLRKSLAQNNGATSIKVRAGGGSPTQSMR